MQKITKEEFDKPSLQPLVSGEGFMIDELEGLNLNEAIIVTTKNWNAGTTPASYIHNMFKKSGKRFSVKELIDKSGWAILRVK